jgi:hypothetical protein
MGVTNRTVPHDAAPRTQYLVLSTQYSVIAIALWLLPWTNLDAQTLLRWNLKPGDAFTVETKQETQSQVAFSSKSATSQIDVGVGLNWTVTTADEKQITIKQTIERISVKLATPQGMPIEFDSASQSRPTGQARSLAESLTPLVGAEMNVTMSRRGEILTVKAANAAAEVLFASGEGASGSAGDSRTAIEHLLRQPLVVLPEKEVTTGDTWTTTSELESAAGPMRQKTDYSLEQFDNEGNQRACRIAVQSELTARPAAAGKNSPSMRIKDQDHSGTITFAVEAGRVVVSDQMQELTTERQYRDVTITVKLSSTQKTTITPAKEQ